MDKYNEKIMDMYINAFCANRAKGNESFDDCVMFAKRAIKSFQEQFPREKYEKKDFIDKVFSSIDRTQDLSEVMFAPKKKPYYGIIKPDTDIEKFIDKFLELVIASNLKEWRDKVALKAAIYTLDIRYLIAALRKSILNQRVKKIYLPNSGFYITINTPNKCQVEEFCTLISGFKESITYNTYKQKKVAIMEQIPFLAKDDNWVLDETTKTLVLDQVCKIQINHPIKKFLLKGLKDTLVFKDWLSLMIGIYKAYLSNTATDVEITDTYSIVPDAIITVNPLTKDTIATFKELSFFKHETFDNSDNVKFICSDSKNQVNMKDEKGDLLKFDICMEAFQYIYMNKLNHADMTIRVIKEEEI